MKTINNTLTAAQKQALSECEEAYRNYEKAPFDAGRALEKIRSQTLYREGFSSFQEYCIETWSCSRSHADRLIGAYRISCLLKPIGVVLDNESQASSLLK